MSKNDDWFDDEYEMSRIKPERQAKRVDARLKPGTMTDEDPDWLIKNLDLDEVEMWLCTLEKHIDDKSFASIRKNTPEYVFDEWERDFFRSVNAQYNLNHVAGYHRSILTGKQLVYLKMIWLRFIGQTRYILDKGATR